MSFASFVQAHAAYADWRVALAQSQRQLQTQIAARAARQGESAPFTLGWCYLSDYYAPAAAAILDELRRRFPGVAWVGAVAVGVAASGVEYINEPVVSIYSVDTPSGRFAVIEVKHPAKPRVAMDHAIIRGNGPSSPDQAVVQPLMVAFCVVPRRAQSSRSLQSVDSGAETSDHG